MSLTQPLKLFHSDVAKGHGLDYADYAWQDNARDCENWLLCVHRIVFSTPQDHSASSPASAAPTHAEYAHKAIDNELDSSSPMYMHLGRKYLALQNVSSGWSNLDRSVAVS